MVILAKKLVVVLSIEDCPYVPAKQQMTARLCRVCQPGNNQEAHVHTYMHGFQSQLLNITLTFYRCSSYVGRKGGRQEVSITRRCDNKGHAMHEIGHALGLWHEHSRPDRDNYIRIIWENIKENRQLNFGLISQEEFRSIPDVGYDLESIMHYGPYAFSVNRNANRTIEVLVNLPSCAKELGQRRELSFKDKLRMSKLYQCTGQFAEE